MRIIFLDFDGVLNSQAFYIRIANQRTGERWHDEIDPLAVAQLNALVLDTGAKVVVTATARSGYTPEDLQKILASQGFLGEVIGKTVDMRYGPFGDCIFRGNEILQWMKSHKDVIGCDYYNYHDYVILDDDSDFLYWQRNNIVLCDRFVGMTPQTVFLAKKVFRIPH